MFSNTPGRPRLVTYRYLNQPACSTTNERGATAYTTSIDAVLSWCAIGWRGFRRIRTNNGGLMATKKKAIKKRAVKKAKQLARPDVPNMFRINVEVGNIDQAADFYSSLFGLTGRKQAGSRCYFTCGPVTLQVVAVPQPHPA